MLVNLTPDLEEIERRNNIALENNIEYISQSDKSWIQEVGIYQENFRFNFTFEEFLEFKNKSRIPLEQSYNLFSPNFEKVSFGISDNIEQIKKYYKEEIEDNKRKFFIACTPVFQDKENKGKGGGWRWHKWGKYIGELNTQFEYLDDEDFGDDFKYVIVFKIVEIL
jgi:hypothetical protein